MNQDRSPSTRWPALFETTLTWLERELSRFLLGATDDPVRQLARLKPLAELALACDIGLTRLDGATHDWGLRQVGRLRKLLEAICDDVDEGSRLEVLNTHLPKPKGVQLSALSTLARTLGRWGAIPSWPRTKWPEPVADDARWLVELDVIAICRQLGFDFSKLYGSPLGILLADYPTLSADAAYMLTHVVFFRTDFGRTPQCLGAGETACLRIWAPTWQQQFADALDLDLLGEMTMLLRCLRVYKDAIDVAAVLQQGQEADGAIAVVQSADIAAEAGADMACDWFRQRYHTTLVANMAASLSTRIA